MKAVSQSLLYRKIYELFVTSIYLCIDLYFKSNFLYLPVINFCSFSKVLLRNTKVNSLKSRTQPVGMLTCNLGNINLEKNWHVPCLVEERNTFLM